MVAVGLKAYLGYRQTLDWLAGLAEVSARFESSVDIVVFPISPTLPRAVELGQLSGFQVGAQDVSDRPPGAYTGELTAAVLAELGVRYVEIGHAERRLVFDESPALIARKVTAVLGQGLVPLICVGEGRIGGRSAVAAPQALAHTIHQLDQVLPALNDRAPFVVGYEPVWAIGADRPAPVEHVRAVADGLRERLAPFPAARLIYGGTAGPGLFDELADVTDGLFVGRRGHDPAALAAVLCEVAGAG